MEGREPPDRSWHRRRRRTARRLLVAGGFLLLGGIAIVIAGLSTSTVAHKPSTRGDNTCPPASTCPAGGASTVPSNPPAASPWTATNIYGGITALTGLIGALTGMLTLRASRHQVPATYYLVAAPSPAMPPGAVPVPGPSRPQHQAQPQAVTADPVSADTTTPDKTSADKPGQDDQPS